MIISNVAPVLDQPQRVFPLAHSWDTPFIASYEYKTDLLRSANGKEQRRAVRFYPRRSFEYTLTYKHDQKYFLDQFFDMSPEKLVWMPEENKVTKTVAEMGEDALSAFVVDADQTWMVPGITVLLQYKGRAETRLLAGAGGGVLTFSENNKTVWPAGTKVTAAQLCRLTIDAESVRLSSAAGTMKVSATVDPGSAPYTPGNGGQQFLDFREYFNQRINWGDAPVITHTYPRDDIDYGFGLIGTYVSEKFPQRTRKVNFWRAGYAEAYELIDFFCRHYGMQREFFVPSIEKEIPYVATAGLTRSVFIEGVHFAEVYKDSTVYRRIMIKRKDGTEIHRVIDFVEALPDTNTSVIWLTEELPDEPLAPSQTLGMFWVTVARLAADRLDVSWLTNRVAQLALPIRNLENPDL